MNTIENSFSVLKPAAISKAAEEMGVYKTNKKPLATFLSAILSGIYISIAFVFYITATTGAEQAPYGMVKLLGGLCFSLGLILIVICGTDLFTSTVLNLLAAFSRRVTFKRVMMNWFLVYVGNLIGALFFVALIWFSGEPLGVKGLWGLNILNTADYKLHHGFIDAIFLGILANFMVCSAVWMSYSGRSLIDKAFIMILPVAMFVASGYEHSIANMFMIPMGIVVKNFAPTEFWQMLHTSPLHYANITVYNFITKNLFPVTLGNIIGGLLVGIPYWWLYLRQPAEKK